MGNSNESIRQNTYKICMKCNKLGELNEDLKILNVIVDNWVRYDNDDEKTLLLRCCKGLCYIM